jgi:nucleotide-binding universal stress UspA family protein
MKILVGYDGSHRAENALALALDHAKTFKAVVVIVTSLQQSPTLHNIDIEKAQSELEYLRTPFNVAGIDCETHVSVSYRTPGEDLVHIAQENRIDCIFTGLKKRSKLRKFILGSTAQYVILEAPCPVISVK